MIESILTTFDNPYDPFDEFDKWLNFDLEKGYNCCGLIDRIARTSGQLSDKENALEINRAIDEIIRYDFQNIYKKVSRSVIESNSDKHSSRYNTRT